VDWNLLRVGVAAAIFAYGAGARIATGFFAAVTAGVALGGTALEAHRMGVSFQAAAEKTGVAPMFFMLLAPSAIGIALGAAARRVRPPLHRPTLMTRGD